MESLFLGIDIGSTTLKAVLSDAKGKVLHTLYTRTKAMESGSKISCSGRCVECGKCNLGSVKKTISDFLAGAGAVYDDIDCTVVTGSQIVDDTQRFIEYDFKVSEVSAHVAGAKHYYSGSKAILDVGGQDSKAMVYSEDMVMWTSKMSGICAAGTGAFLDSVAAKLNIPVDEMADKVNYDSELEFSSVCAVLSATSINKFKSRFPIGEIIGGACRAQARTVMFGVGELLLNYKGDIIFQGGVAYNRAVAYFLKEITGNNIIIPEFHSVMGALGAAILAKEFFEKKHNVAVKHDIFPKEKPKAIGLRTKLTRKEFFSKRDVPLVWRNLFYPTEILNAFDVRILTLDTYAALYARNQKSIKGYFDNAAYKGFSAETCSFLRVLEGLELPQPDFAVSTSEPCQQGERIFYDLAKDYGIEDSMYSLQTPINNNENAVENIAAALEESVERMEKSLNLKMDPQRLKEACELSNQAREMTNKCAELRFTSPPLVRGTDAVYFASVFSQSWGKQELVDLQTQFYNDLLIQKEKIEKRLTIDDTHRILWLHLPPFYDSRLLEYIEVECNAPIIFEEVNFADWEKLDVNDPYRSLAKKLLTVGFLDPVLRVNHIVDAAKDAKFSGCILYNHAFGRCSLADSCFIKLLREGLAKSNIPLLVLDGDCMDSTIDPCSTYTKVSAYVEALNQKKYGNIFGEMKSSPVINDSKDEFSFVKQQKNKVNSA